MIVFEKPMVCNHCGKRILFGLFYKLFSNKLFGKWVCRCGWPKYYWDRFK